MQEEWVYFVRGTTTSRWPGGMIDPMRGGGDYGRGFYTFADTRWGRQAAGAWARQKARQGGAPILVRVGMRRSEFEALDRQDVPTDDLDGYYRRYSRSGLTGKEIVAGLVGRRGIEGSRVPDYRLPIQYKFEGTGVAKLVIDSVIPVRGAER